jgi:membrane fusion protein, heavy metal efflux system
MFKGDSTMTRAVHALCLVLIGAVLAFIGMTMVGPGRLPSWSHSWVPAMMRDETRPSIESPGTPETRPTALAELIDDGWCSAPHQHPVSDPTAEGGKNGAERCRRLLPIVRLSSPQIAGRIGLETGTTVRRRHAHRLAGNAEIDFAAHNYAEVRPRVTGWIREVRVDEGQKVRKGDVLVVIDSAEVGSAKAHYLTALPAVELNRINDDAARELIANKIVSPKRGVETQAAWNQAKANLLNARQKLLNLGLTDADLTRIAEKGETSSLLEVVAPMDGALVERFAVVGVAVEPTAQLFVEADISIMWAWIDVYETEIDLVAPGQEVSLTIAGTEAPVFKGQVELIGASVNPSTRTVRVRAEFHNPDGRLRAKQFGRAEIRIGAEHEAVIVPRSAVQNDGQADLVFLLQGDGGYRPQRIKARPAESPDVLEVEWGLSADQRVVTTGAFLLKSELLKSIHGEKIFGGED